MRTVHAIAARSAHVSFRAAAFRVAAFRAVACLSVAALLAGCGGNGQDDVDAIELGDGQPGLDDGETGGDDAGGDAGGGADGDGGTGGAATDDGPDAGDAADDTAGEGDRSGEGADGGADDTGGDGTGGDGTGGDGTGGDGDGPGATDTDADDGTGDDRAAPVDTGHLADLTVAEAGEWPVGNAGTVTFDVDGRDLVLRDIDGAPGWSIEVEEDERDEIEVVFRRDDVRWRFEVERSGRHLEIVIQQRIRDARTGGYDLGDAGTFAFDVVDRRLVLTSLEVADGWRLRDRDVDDEDIELELRSDDRRVEVEVELDGRTVELDISYRLRDRLP